MYHLVFPTHTIKLNSLQEWHSLICSYNREGITYREYRRVGYVWKFFF